MLRDKYEKNNINNVNKGSGRNGKVKFSRGRGSQRWIATVLIEAHPKLRCNCGVVGTPTKSRALGEDSATREEERELEEDTRIGWPDERTQSGAAAAARAQANTSSASRRARRGPAPALNMANTGAMPPGGDVGYVSVRDFYRDRSIFITGGTGFMGKVLVEKLLRSCAGIKNIYLLMRPKRGQDVQQRLQELLNAPVSIPIPL